MEKLPHQALLARLEDFELPGMGDDLLLQRGQAIGDFLLFGEVWSQLPMLLKNHIS
jgi:hypothetical protein